MKNYICVEDFIKDYNVVNLMETYDFPSKNDTKDLTSYLLGYKGDEIFISNTMNNYIFKVIIKNTKSGRISIGFDNNKVIIRNESLKDYIENEIKTIIAMGSFGSTLHHILNNVKEINKVDFNFNNVEMDTYKYDKTKDDDNKNIIDIIKSIDLNKECFKNKTLLWRE